MPFAIVPSGESTTGIGKLVPRSHLEVVRVVRGRDLHCARAEFRIDADRVSDDRNLDVRDGQRDGLADQIP